MSNVSVNVEEKEMSLIERAQKVIKEQKEAIVLVQRLEALKAELKVAEESLEERLNSIESINIEQVNSEIEETSSKLEATKTVLEELNTLDSCIECPREPKVGKDPNTPNPLHTPSGDALTSKRSEEAVEPPTEEELADTIAYVEKLEQGAKEREQEERDRKYDIADITLDDEIDSNRDKVVDNLERQFRIGPTQEDRGEFVIYFNRKYFDANGVKMKHGDYESLIRTIESKEGTKVTPAEITKGKLKWLRSLYTTHRHMFDEECLADLENRIKELEEPTF